MKENDNVGMILNDFRKSTITEILEELAKDSTIIINDRSSDCQLATLTYDDMFHKISVDDIKLEYGELYPSDSCTMTLCSRKVFMANLGRGEFYNQYLK